MASKPTITARAPTQTGADTTTALLQQLQSGQISLAQCEAALSAKGVGPAAIQYKVTPKGCIGFYNVRRMPISLYVEELERILDTILEPGYSYNTDFTVFLDNPSLSRKSKEEP